MVGDGSLCGLGQSFQSFVVRVFDITLTIYHVLDDNMLKNDLVDKDIKKRFKVIECRRCADSEGEMSNLIVTTRY